MKKCGSAGTTIILYYIIFKGVDFMVKTNVTTTAEVMAASAKGLICKCFANYDEALVYAKSIYKGNDSGKVFKAYSGDIVTVLDGGYDYVMLMVA